MITSGLILIGLYLLKVSGTSTESYKNEKLINSGKLRNYYKNFASNKFPNNKFLKKNKLYLK